MRKFEFVVNLEAAKQIGLTIPPEVLAPANTVIKSESRAQRAKRIPQKQNAGEHP